MKTLFISMIGLEERVLGAFKKQKVRADYHLFLYNKEYAKNANVKKFRKILCEKYLKGKRYAILSCSYLEPEAVIDTLKLFLYVEKIKFDEEEFQVILDISTFNRQNLLVILRELRITYNVKHLRIIYTVPQKVNPEISKGANGFSVVPGFRGKIFKSRKKILVLLLGYEMDRPLLLWKELRPYQVILGKGEKQTANNFSAQNKIVVEKAHQFGPSEIAMVCVNHPFTARDQLCELFKKHINDYNIFASPFNTKLQTVGLYLAWEKYQNVRLVIAHPFKFDSWLTKGIKDILTFDI